MDTAIIHSSTQATSPGAVDTMLSSRLTQSWQQYQIEQKDYHDRENSSSGDATGLLQPHTSEAERQHIPSSRPEEHAQRNKVPSLDPRNAPSFIPHSLQITKTNPTSNVHQLAASRRSLGSHNSCEGIRYNSGLSDQANQLQCDKLGDSRGDDSSVASSFGPMSPVQPFGGERRVSISSGPDSPHDVASSLEYRSRAWPIPAASHFKERGDAAHVWPQMLPEELSASREVQWKARIHSQETGEPAHSRVAYAYSATMQEPYPWGQIGSSSAGSLETKWRTSNRCQPSHQDRVSPTTPANSSGRRDVFRAFSPVFSILVENLHPEVGEEDLLLAFLRPPPYTTQYARQIAEETKSFGSDEEPTRLRPGPFHSVRSVRLILDPLSSTTQGSALVSFADERDCIRAVIEMQGMVIANAKCPSSGKPLRLSHIDAQFGKHAVTACSFGVHNVREPQQEDLQHRPYSTHASPQGPGRYSTPTAAEIASHSAAVPIPPSWPGGIPSLPGFPTIPATGALGPVDVGLRNGIQLGTSYGGPASLAGTGFTLGPSTLPSPSSALDPNNTTVFVGGLSSLISEDTLKTFFSPFGAIAYVKIPPGKGCGFVSFLRKVDAEKAIERMQGFPVGGCRIRLSWGRSQGEKSQHLAQQQINNLHQLANLAGMGDLRGLKPHQLAHLATIGQALAQQSAGASTPVNSAYLAPSLPAPSSASHGFSPTYAPLWPKANHPSNSSFFQSPSEEAPASVRSTASRSTYDPRLSATSQPFDMSQKFRLRSGLTADSFGYPDENDHELSSAIGKINFASKHEHNHLNPRESDRIGGGISRTWLNYQGGNLEPRTRQHSLSVSRSFLESEGAEDQGRYRSASNQENVPLTNRQNSAVLKSSLWSGPVDFGFPLWQAPSFEDRKLRTSEPDSANLCLVPDFARDITHSNLYACSRGSSLTGIDTMNTTLTTATSSGSGSLGGASHGDTQSIAPKSYKDNDSDECHVDFSPFSPLPTPGKELSSMEERSQSSSTEPTTQERVAEASAHKEDGVDARGSGATNEEEDDASHPDGTQRPTK